jgi:uncharacterized protein YcaQ
MASLSIDPVIARRFILGKQGLWPGRRWRGMRGVEQAMRAVEHLQLDPLQIAARSQDIMLNCRVVDYKPEQWQKLAYEDRKFFDWGGWLAVRPMDELPYWRRLMQEERDDARWASYLHSHNSVAAIEEMRAVLRERGTVSNRDFAMKDRSRTTSYRGRKDSAVALYYLWYIGEVMTHHRERFERVYALTENVAPANLIYAADAEATNQFLLKKQLAFYGLHPLNKADNGSHHPLSVAEMKQRTQTLLANNKVIEVNIEGWKMPHYTLAGNAPLLTDLMAGRVPKAWRPIDTTTTDEVSLIAPLDPVSARGRALRLFNFAYTWEVYTPEPKRQFGYYALPILWGDALVARMDVKLDRTTRTFVVCGLWLEDKTLATNSAFADALARGVTRFMRFLDADKLDVRAIKQPLLRKRAKEAEKI